MRAPLHAELQRKRGQGAFKPGQRLQQPGQRPQQPGQTGRKKSMRRTGLPFSYISKM